MQQKLKRTKIVCTMGPACDNDETICEMLKAGMNVARFNFSHGSYEEHQGRIERVRRCAAKVGKPVGILLDTKGPEVRTGLLEGHAKVEVHAGDKITVTAQPTSEDWLGNASHISLDYEKLPSEAEKGSIILIDDGLVGLEVESVDGQDMHCVVLNNGLIGERKGVNIPNVDISLPAVTERDRQDILFGLTQNIDYIAASFIRNGKAVEDIRQLCRENGGEHVTIFPKIECALGVENFDEILEASDGIMVARGDLGVELPAEVIPNTQRRIVEKCICAKRPVIIATQMLYSMVKSPRPTRAEVSDVASAIYERVDAVMLSDETAMGDFPVQSVETMARIAREIERDETHFKPMIDMDMVSVNHEITAQLARSAVRASTNLPIKYVVLDTKTGRTGRYLAAFRGRKTVMAVCYQLHAQRILALSYGVVPILRNQELSDRYHFLVDALEFLDQYRKLDDGDLMAIVGGSFGPDGGASYVEIANVQNIRKRNEEIVAQHNC